MRRIFYTVLVSILLASFSLEGTGRTEQREQAEQVEVFLQKELQELAGGQTQIWDMEVFKDKLYLLVSTQPMESSGGYLLCYDGETWEQALTFPGEQGVYRMTLSPDYLIIAGSDDSANDGKGNIYLYDGTSVIEREVAIPGYQTDHNVSVAYHQGSIFVVNALKDPGGDWGRIFRSDDMGESWTKSYENGLNWHPNEIYATKSSGVMAACGYVMNLENLGSNWNKVDIQDQTVTEVYYVFKDFPYADRQVVRFAEFGDTLYACGDQGIWKFDGSTFVNSYIQADVLFWDMTEHNGEFYAVSSGVPVSEKPIMYSAPGVEYMEPDGVDNAQLWKMDSTTGVWGVVYDLPEDRALSLASYHGELHIGTGIQSRVYTMSEAVNGPAITPNFPTEAEMAAIRAEGVIRWNTTAKSFVFENVTDGPISTGAGKHYYFTDHGVYVGGAFGVYIPGSYRSDTPMPVVFASHGAYGMGPRELNNWEGVAENHGFIVVAPSYSFATNHYIEGNGAGANIESERHMTAEIMEKLLASDLNIDTTRILATGFSGGGMPTHYMMMKHPRYFTAFCLRSANYSTFYSLDIDLNYWRKKPGYVFWSDNDVSFIPGQGEDFLKDFLKTEDDESWSSAQSDGLIHWTSANGKTEWQENSIGHNHAAELTASWFMELDSADWAIPLDTSNYISINSNELSAVVYPNPVEDLLKVVLSDVVYQKELEIEISSVKGDLMMCDSIIYNGSIHIDMSSFPSGTYFVRLSVEGKQFVNTILKS